VLSLPIRRAVLEQDGFTLIELLVSTFILTVGVMVAWAAIMSATTKSAGRAQELADLQTEVRRAVDSLAADLRQAQGLDATTLPVTTATTTQVTFYSPDRLTPFHLRQVSYRLSGGQFQRAFATSTNTGGPPWTIPALGSWSTLVGSVTNASILTYKDAANQATTNPSAVASANVKLVITPRAGLGGAGSTYQTNIALRADTCS
jgi:prepilin-type N-terminal cleavage/methylation domain-containing protein